MLNVLAIGFLAACGLALAGDDDPARPQSGEVLTLGQAIEIALESNHAMDVAAARIDEATASLAEARSGRWPRLALSETVSRTTNQVMVFGQLLSQESFTAANFDVGFLNDPDPLNNFATRVTLGQSLWSGGRVGAGVDAADTARRAESEHAARVSQEVVHGTIEAYTGAVLAERSLGVAREALETAEAHVELVADLRKGGLVVESDLLQAKVRESEVRELVYESEAQAAVARAGLDVAMGLPVGSHDYRLPVDLAEPSAEDESIEALEREAFERRPDIAAVALRAEAARQSVRAERAGFYPSVDAGASYEAHAEDAPGTDGTNWSVMLMARFEVFDGGETKARVAQAEARARQAAGALELMRSRVALEIRTAWHGLRAARQRLETARDAVRMAEESLRVVEDRYREGLVTIVELQDAETDLTRARVRTVAARRHWLLRKAALDLAVGRL
jgi:outer membrane protein TolC